MSMISGVSKNKSNEYLKKIMFFEGSKNYMYCDSRGNVTIGVGNMLPNSNAAAKLGFKKGKSQATTKQIKDDFEKVKNNYKKGYKASYYKQFSDVRLADKTIKSNLKEEIKSVVKRLKVRISKYNKNHSKTIDFIGLPANVKVAMVDMAYNLGLNGLFNKFPTFLKHIANGDYKKAAKESKRGGIQKSRNEYIKNLLKHPPSSK